MGGTRHSDQGRATATCRDGAAGRGPGRRRGRSPADPGARGRCEGSGLRVIVLDTNVIAEILRPSPEARVVDWLTSLTGGVAITSVTLAELLAGVRRLSDGRRKDSRSEEHTSELQSRGHLVCRLLLEKKKRHEPRSASTDLQRNGKRDG